jgi:hypothetical protein
MFLNSIQRKIMNIFGNRAALALALAVLTSSAQSASLYCNGGTVATLAFHQPGTLYVRMSNMNTPVAICSMTGDWVVPGALVGPTPASQCKSIYAALLIAKQSNQPVTEMLFDGDGVPAGCSAFAPWTPANLRWIVF